MHCPLQVTERAELATAYCAGKLDAEATIDFARHLETCESCRACVAAQKTVSEKLDAWETPEISPGFDRSLHQKIEAEYGSWWSRLLGSGLGPLPRPLLPLAVACAVVLVALLLQPSRNASAPPARVESVDIEQVERVLEDLEMLQQLNVIPPREAGTSQSL